MGHLEDHTLLDLITTGNEEALKCLHGRYSRALVLMAVKMLGDVGAAEEIAQDTFTKVWNCSGQYRSSKGKVSTWIFSIGKNRAIDEARRRARNHRTLNSYWALGSHHSEADMVDDFVMQKDRAFLVGKLLDQLGHSQRIAVHLSFYEGFSHAEIAEMLDQPLGTIKTRIRLGLRKLRGHTEKLALNRATNYRDLLS